MVSATESRALACACGAGAAAGAGTAPSASIAAMATTPPFCIRRIGPPRPLPGPPIPQGEISTKASPESSSTASHFTHDSSRCQSGPTAPRLVESGGKQPPVGKRPSGRGAANGAKRSRLRSCIEARSSAAPASTGRPRASLTVTRKVSRARAPDGRGRSRTRPVSSLLLHGTSSVAPWVTS